MKELWTCLASIIGVFAFFQTLINTIFPPDIHFALLKLFRRLFPSFSSSYCYFDITEVDGVNTNELYNAVQLYLSSSASVSGSRLSLTRALNSSAFTFGLSSNGRLVDSFRGSTATWDHVVSQRQTQSFSWRPLPEEKRGFTLRIKKKDKPLILEPYLDHIMEKAAEVKRRNQDRLLYTNSRGGAMDGRSYPWESVPFKHPSTFDTLAMDPFRKDEIMDDLRGFAEGKGFYERTGRAWKRGYLLYGPPGTGKSSTIAAMANFLGYDIYDLELTEVHTNSELRKLLMKTSSKSIIVIEDIDCSINLSSRVDPNNVGPMAVPPVNEEESIGPKSITLSGLLNFTDGLWSCCGSERIFVFTTNRIEKLDPALLRSGRMDMHIFMSYCSFPALKILMKNYLGLEEDGEIADSELMMRELEEVVEKAEMTPADISEILIKNRRRDKDKAVKELLEVLKARVEGKKKKKKKKKGKGRKREGEEMEEEEEEEEEEQEKRALESPKGEDVAIMENGNGKEDGRGELNLLKSGELI